MRNVEWKGRAGVLLRRFYSDDRANHVRVNVTSCKPLFSYSAPSRALFRSASSKVKSIIVPLRRFPPCFLHPDYWSLFFFLEGKIPKLENSWYYETLIEHRVCSKPFFCCSNSFYKRVKWTSEEVHFSFLLFINKGKRNKILERKFILAPWLG